MLPGLSPRCQLELNPACTYGGGLTRGGDAIPCLGEDIEIRHCDAEDDLARIGAALGLEHGDGVASVIRPTASEVSTSTLLCSAAQHEAGKRTLERGSYQSAWPLGPIA